MHLKYFEWEQSKEPEKPQWDPTVDLTRQQVVSWWLYQGSAPPVDVSPGRWAAMCRQAVSYWWSKDD